jgi:hypothetical protein
MLNTRTHATSRIAGLAASSSSLVHNLCVLAPLREIFGVLVRASLREISSVSLSRLCVRVLAPLREIFGVLVRASLRFPLSTYRVFA